MFQSIITTDGCIGTNSGVNSLEHVQAVVVFDYTSRPDIEIKLQSPSGFVSTLFNDVHLDSNITSGKNWTYMSVQHWGEDPAGSWVLKLSMKTNMSSRGMYLCICTLVPGQNFRKRSLFLKKNFRQTA